MSQRHSDRPLWNLVSIRCQSLGYSPRTAESYSRRLAHFEDWFGGSAMEAEQHHAAAWLATEAQRRQAPTSLLHDRHALTFLFRHLRGLDLDERVVPRARRPPPREPPVPSPDDVSMVLNAITQHRYRLFCSFIYATGMRLREALAVRWCDIDERDRSILVRLGKGRRQRRTILADTLVRLLREHRTIWQTEALIFADRDVVLDPDNIRFNLRLARLACGILHPITIHHLRRCFATHLHERGVGLGELQRLLGHASVITTLSYIGMRELRRTEIAVAGDLLAALPHPRPVQQTIEFSSLR